MQRPWLLRRLERNPAPFLTPLSPTINLAQRSPARKLAALSKRSAGASGVETLTARTAFACSSTVKLVMHAECSHKEGKKRSKNGGGGGGGTHWVVTARVKQDYAVRVTHEACAPLAPTPAATGGGWDVPWRDHAGRSHVTHSHRGLLEVRSRRVGSDVWRTARDPDGGARAPSRRRRA